MMKPFTTEQSDSYGFFLGRAESSYAASFLKEDFVRRSVTRRFLMHGVIHRIPEMLTATTR
jgi:hypothetical protein